MKMLALALAPGVAICLFIFYRDAYNREPAKKLLLSFLLGAAAVFPAALIEQLVLPFFPGSVAGIAAMAFIGVALTEELVKFLALRFYAYPQPSFDEPLDGIVYAVMIGMGFASLENIMYLSRYGLEAGWYRMAIAVPAHACFAVLMGYHIGKAKFSPDKELRFMLTGLGAAVLFHGAYDFFLFLQGHHIARQYASDGLLFILAFLSFALALRYSIKHLRLHRRLSHHIHYPLANMMVRKAFETDIPLIKGLAYRTWPTAYGEIIPKEQLDYMLDYIYKEEALQKQMREGQEFVILQDGLEPVGFASTSLIKENIFKLNKIYLLPSQQGKGAGKFLLNWIVNHLEKKGGEKLILNVNRHNPAINFYEKLGFVITGQEDVDIQNGYFMNDYIMEKKLRPGTA